MPCATSLQAVVRQPDRRKNNWERKLFYLLTFALMGDNCRFLLTRFLQRFSGALAAEIGCSKGNALRGRIAMSNPRADSHGKKAVPFDSKTASQSPPQSNLSFLF